MIKKIRAGKLRNLVTVQVSTTGRDAFAGITDSWATHTTLWCDINAAGGTERFGDDQITGDLTYEFIGRVDPSVTRITADMRISWNSRLFNVEQALPYRELQHGLRIIAKERDV